MSSLELRRAVVRHVSRLSFLLTTYVNSGEVGAPDRGPQCRRSNLRNGKISVFFSNFHVDFKMLLCRMSNSRNGLGHINDNIMFCFMPTGSMSRVDFRNGHVPLTNLRVKDHMQIGKVQKGREVSIRHGAHYLGKT